VRYDASPILEVVMPARADAVHRHADGSINFDFYRRQALRRRHRYLKHLFARSLGRSVAAARWSADLLHRLLAKLAIRDWQHRMRGTRAHRRCDMLPLTIELADDPQRRHAGARSVQDRRDVSERDTREIGPGAYPAYNHIGTVVVASAGLVFYVVATFIA
jgi:hypothetical protein